MVLGSEDRFGGTVMVFGALVNRVVFTTFNASFEVAIIQRVAVGLTVVTLSWTICLFLYGFSIDTLVFSSDVISRISLLLSFVKISTNNKGRGILFFVFDIVHVFD